MDIGNLLGQDFSDINADALNLDNLPIPGQTEVSELAAKVFDSSAQLYQTKKGNVYQLFSNALEPATV